MLLSRSQRILIYRNENISTSRTQAIFVAMNLQSCKPVKRNSTGNYTETITQASMHLLRYYAARRFVKFTVGKNKKRRACHVNRHSPHQSEIWKTGCNSMNTNYWLRVLSHDDLLLKFPRHNFTSSFTKH